MRMNRVLSAILGAALLLLATLSSHGAAKRPVSAPASRLDSDAAAVLAKSPLAQDGPCLAVVATRVYHRLSCPLTKNLPRDGFELFPSALNALELGYAPCPMCNPSRPALTTTDEAPEIDSLFREDPDNPKGFRVRGTPILGRFSFVLGREPWLNTHIQVGKGQVLAVRAAGWITTDPGTDDQAEWNPDGVNRQGNYSSGWGWRQRNYLWARVGGKTIRLNSTYFGVIPGSGELQLGFRSGSNYKTNVGFFRVFIAIFQPGATLIEAEKKARTDKDDKANKAAPPPAAAGSAAPHTAAPVEPAAKSAAASR